MFIIFHFSDDTTLFPFKKYTGPAFLKLHFEHCYYYYYYYYLYYYHHYHHHRYKQV
jgi:hypothetical protein